MMNVFEHFLIYTFKSYTVIIHEFPLLVKPNWNLFSGYP